MNPYNTSHNNRNKYEKARRRLAAVTFLSNISLDGSFRDTELSQIANKSRSENGNKTGESEDIDAKALVHNSSRLTHCSPAHGATTDNNSSTSSDSDHSTIASIKAIAAAFRDRCASAATESYKEKLAGRSKKRLVTISGIPTDDRSSTESLSCARFMASNPSIPEYHAVTNEVQIVHPTKGVSFNDERLVFTMEAPVVLYSHIPCSKTIKTTRKEGGRKRHTAGSKPLSAITDNGVHPFDLLGIERDENAHEISYCKFLVPTKLPPRDHHKKAHDWEPGWKMMNRPHSIARAKMLTRHKDKKKWCFSYESSQRHQSETSPPHSSVEGKTFDWDDASIKSHALVHYCPNVLDDPELIVGKHRTLLTFTSYMTSIIDHVRPQDLKKELNEKFREQFPHIKLTLSKLRSIKKEMRKIAKHDNSNGELLTVAQAYVYFEKLILANLINKANRKLCAGACLILSAKLNDVKGENLTSLIDRTETRFRVNRKDLLRFEFAVLVGLEFGLHVPVYEVFPHYQRLLHES